MHGKNIRKPAILILLIYKSAFVGCNKKTPKKRESSWQKQRFAKKKNKKKAANVARLYLDGSTSLAVAPSYTFLFATKI